MSTEAIPRRRTRGPDWQRAVRHFVPLSERWQDVRLGRAEARRILRCEEQTLDRLCELGLPSRDGPDGQSFGECDVMNVALASGGGRTVPELALDRALRFAVGTRADWLEERSWSIVLAASCSCGDPVGEWTLPRPLLESRGVGLEGGGAIAAAGGGVEARFEVRTRGRIGRVADRSVRELLDETVRAFDTGDLRFHYLPEALQRQPREALAAGVVNCVALSLHLAADLSDRGVPVATRHGHLLSAIGVEHAWLELGSAPEERVAVDPMLILLARDAAGVRAEFAAFCLGSLSNRTLAWNRAADEPLARHCDGGAEHRARVTVSARARRR